MVCCCLPGLISISTSNASSFPASLRPISLQVALSSDIYFSINFFFILILCDFFGVDGLTSERSWRRRNGSPGGSRMWLPIQDRADRRFGEGEIEHPRQFTRNEFCLDGIQVHHRRRVRHQNSSGKLTPSSYCSSVPVIEFISSYDCLNFSFVFMDWLKMLRKLLVIGCYWALGGVNGGWIKHNETFLWGFD